MATIKAAIPKEYQISAKRQKDGRYRLKYREVFDGKELPPEGFQNTLKMIKPLMKMAGLKLTSDPETRTYTIQGIVPLELLASMVTAEFVAASNLGEVTLRDMLVFMCAGANKICELTGEAQKPEGE